MSEHDRTVHEQELAQDRSLMERIHAGDPSALDTVLQRYWAALVSYANRLLLDRDAAEDIVQETMFVLWSKRATWTPTQRLRGFLYQITRNLALNERKRVQIRVRRADAACDSAPAPSPLDDAEQTELERLLDRVLDELPRRRREVFILARYHGHTYREIAEIMEISPQTVANQMSAALDELRDKLRPFIDASLARGRLHVIQGGGADSHHPSPGDRTE